MRCVAALLGLTPHKGNKGPDHWHGSGNIGKLGGNTAANLTPWGHERHGSRCALAMLVQHANSHIAEFKAEAPLGA